MKNLILAVLTGMLIITTAPAQTGSATSDLHFSKAVFAKNHWIAYVTVEGPNALQFAYDDYPELRRVRIENGDTFVQRKGKEWRKSDNWNENGPAVDNKTTNELNTMASIPQGPLKDPTSHDQSQGGFVWKHIAENSQSVTYELSRENPRSGGFYPRYVFSKSGNAPEGQLLTGFQGQFIIGGQPSPATIRYELMILVNGETKTQAKSKKVTSAFSWPQQNKKLIIASPANTFAQI